MVVFILGMKSVNIFVAFFCSYVNNTYILKCNVASIWKRSCMTKVYFLLFTTVFIFLFIKWLDIVARALKMIIEMASYHSEWKDYGLWIVRDMQLEGSTLFMETW